MLKIDIVTERILNMTIDELKGFIVDNICPSEFGLSEHDECDECMCQHCWYQEINNKTDLNRL